jgi:hypothetical protein
MTDMSEVRRATSAANPPKRKVSARERKGLAIIAKQLAAEFPTENIAENFGAWLKSLSDEVVFTGDDSDEQAQVFGRALWAEIEPQLRAGTPESSAFAKPQAGKLSPEDFALRRQGIAAATQMLMTIETVAENAKDKTYDASHVKVQHVLAEYLQALPRHVPAAQQGFLFVLADHLFNAYGHTGVMYTNVHERPEFHTNPPLTRLQMIDDSLCPTEELREHRGTGKALTPRERAALAQKWRAAFKRVNAGDTAIKRSNAGTAARRARKSPIEQGATQCTSIPPPSVTARLRRPHSCTSSST